MTNAKKYQAIVSIKSQPTNIQAVLYLNDISPWSMPVEEDFRLPNVLERYGNSICIDKPNDGDDELHGCHTFCPHVTVQSFDWYDCLKWSIREGEQAIEEKAEAHQYNTHLSRVE
jgi:hypothetical protein